MTLEEAEKIADIIEAGQEIDLDMDAAILLVELFENAFPDFKWNINMINGKVSVRKRM